MTHDAFELARQALTTIEFYRNFHGSSQPFQERFREVLIMLRGTAANKSDERGEKKFLLAFADALEVANVSGPYQPLSER